MDTTYGEQAKLALEELLSYAKLEAGDILVIGCSSSEIIGEHIGKSSSPEVAEEIVQTILAILKQKKIYLAAQCCEHLNRAIIIEKSAARQYGYPIVNVVPQPKAGGSFATAAYRQMESPVAVEYIRAQAGLDIGDTLIGMHLQEVAVPVRLQHNQIGSAHITAARVRPKFIGGSRAQYHADMM